MRAAVIFGLLATNVLGALADCPCGYRTNSHDVWQYSILTDFRGLSLGQFQASPDWEITSRVWQTRPYGINYTTANVDVAKDALQLTVSGVSNTTKAIASAQIKTKRQDILFGSLRARFSVVGASGAIGALFFYANDTQEADIEILTRDDPRYVHFTNQPSSHEQIFMPNGAVRTDTNNYRLDWKNGETKSYVNNVLSNTMTRDVPQVDGSVYMNMWSNGGSFSGPPPTTDGTMSISWIQLYFNTSDTSLAKAWEDTCTASRAKVCKIDEDHFGTNSTSTSAGHKHGKGISSSKRPKGGKETEIRKSSPTHKYEKGETGVKFATIAPKVKHGKTKTKIAKPTS
jgi:hypothetical protein